MLYIYARQSVDKKDSISIENQIEHCKLQIAALGISEEIKVYVDKGFSGKNTNRPDFEKMMSDMRREKVSKVVVYKLDRISRSTLDFAQIIETFKKLDVDFISTQEKFDTSTPMGNAMLSIIMVFAQLERETIQQRIKDNYYARGKLGMYLGGPAPFGYKKVAYQLNGKKTYSLEVDEEQVSTLMKIFDLYANTNMSLGQITKGLNDENRKSPKGSPWDSCKLSRIMRNPVYVKSDANIFTYYKSKGCVVSNDVEDFVGENGCYLYGKRPATERKYANVEDHTLSIALHQGVVSSDVFLKCQYKLDGNTQIKRSGASEFSWLSGLTKCPYCGYAMTVSYGDRKYLLFMCSGRKNKIPCARKKLSYYVSEVEAYVEAELLEHLSLLRDRSITSFEVKEDNSLNIQAVKIDEQIQSLINQVAEGSAIVNKYLNAKIEELDTERKRLYDAMQKQKAASIDDTQMLSYLDMVKNWGKLGLDEKKTVAKTFIQKVELFDDRIRINFKKNWDFLA